MAKGGVKLKGSIRPRGNAYEYVIDIGKDPITKKRSQETGTFPTYEEAENALIEINQKLRSGQRMEKRTLEEIITNFYEKQVKKKVREGTYTAQMSLVSKIITRLGKKQIDKITHEDIEDFYDDLETDEEWSRGSIRNLSDVLRKTFKYALTRRYISYDVAKDVSPGTYDRTKYNVWNSDQVQYFLDNTKECYQYPFYLLAFATGMRVGELLSLYPRDLLKETNEVNVESTLKYVSLKGYVVGDPKTKNSFRKVLIPPAVMSYLLNYVRPGATYLFENDERSFWRAETVRNNFRKDIKKCELPHLRIHDIRHTVATTLLSRRIDVTVVAEILGDTVNTVYNTYAHVIPSMRSEATQTLESSFFENISPEPVDKSLILVGSEQ